MGDLNGNGRCDLTGDYEIPAFTKCESWDTVDVSMKLAFKVAGDCSIQISPITDPTCADPTDARNNPDSPLYDPDVHQYGKFGWLGLGCSLGQASHRRARQRLHLHLPSRTCSRRGGPPAQRPRPPRHQPLAPLIWCRQDWHAWLLLLEHTHRPF